MRYSETPPLIYIVTETQLESALSSIATKNLHIYCAFTQKSLNTKLIKDIQYSHFKSISFSDAQTLYPQETLSVKNRAKWLMLMNSKLCASYTLTITKDYSLTLPSSKCEDSMPSYGLRPTCTAVTKRKYFALPFPYHSVFFDNVRYDSTTKPWHHVVKINGSVFLR